MPTVNFEDFWSVSGGCVWQGEKQLDEVQSTLLFYGTSQTLDRQSLDSIMNAEGIAKQLLESPSAWSVVYYRPDLRLLFIGRDIYGRLSLVCNRSETGNFLLSPSVQRQISNSAWLEVPYGQISAINVDHLEAELFSLLETYPEEQDRTYKELFQATRKSTWIDAKSDMLNVSSQVGSLSTPCPSSELFRKLIDTTMNILGRESLQEAIASSVGSLAVGFSGGVDSLLVAHAVVVSSARTQDEDKEVIIDLVNVAFGDNETTCSRAPDRDRALASFGHLKETYPERQFRLILVDVSEAELQENRPTIAKAAAPSISVLDDSLACVLWFALRGRGRDAESGQEICSQSKLFFVGSGADELFAGYGRHRTRYAKDGHAAVAEECTLELCRLGSRNGGRDARVAAQLEKILIAPFLEESLVKWANSLPVLAKCDLSMPRGKGEKKIIREALMTLGSPHDAPKQAMQFGSRIAKMSNGGERLKGSDVSRHLQA